MKSTDFFQAGFKADFDVFETRRLSSITADMAFIEFAKFLKPSV